MFVDTIEFSEAWGATDIDSLPSSMLPWRDITTPLMLQGYNYATPAVLYVYTNGKVVAKHKGGEYISSWGFASVSYPVA